MTVSTRLSIPALRDRLTQGELILRDMPEDDPRLIPALKQWQEWLVEYEQRVTAGEPE